ncbi:hypothetical protein [Nocardia sp. NPDC051750]|uniref:hypothetical protein n=1 Tax=Nocardia sp. NPDC051750 TaxID=3364325 RepID=UPI0037B15C61
MDDKTLEFDEQKFRSAAGAVDAVGDLIGDVLNTLASAMESRGAVWGNDQLGATFYDGVGGQDGYRENSAGLTGSIGSSAESIHGLSVSMRNIADVVRAMEDDNRAGFGRVNGK